MARIIGYYYLPPLYSLDSSRAHYYDRQWPSPSLPSSPPLILSLHDIVIYLSLMLLIVGHSRYGGSGVGDGGGEWARKAVMAPIIKFPWQPCEMVEVGEGGESSPQHLS